MERQPERTVVEYMITFTVPEESVDRQPDEPLRSAVERAVQRMVLGLTDSYPYDHQFDAEDPYTVTVKIETFDDQDRKPPTERLDEALKAIARMLGQRCTNTADGYNDELLIDLHSDLAALELLVAHGWADKHDREGRVTGYMH